MTKEELYALADQYADLMGAEEFLVLVNYALDSEYDYLFWILNERQESGKKMVFDDRFIEYCGYAAGVVRKRRQNVETSLKSFGLEYEKIKYGELEDDLADNIKMNNPRKNTPCIVIEPDAFRQFCMQCQKAVNIRLYYIEFEKVFKYYSLFQKRQLENQTRFFELQNKRLMVDNQQKQTKIEELSEMVQKVINQNKELLGKHNETNASLREVQGQLRGTEQQLNVANNNLNDVQGQLQGTRSDLRIVRRDMSVIRKNTTIVGTDDDVTYFMVVRFWPDNQSRKSYVEAHPQSEQWTFKAYGRQKKDIKGLMDKQRKLYATRNGSVISVIYKKKIAAPYNKVFQRFMDILKGKVNEVEVSTGTKKAFNVVDSALNTIQVNNKIKDSIQQLYRELGQVNDNQY